MSMNERRSNTGIVPPWDITTAKLLTPKKSTNLSKANVVSDEIEKIETSAVNVFGKSRNSGERRCHGENAEKKEAKTKKLRKKMPRRKSGGIKMPSPS